MRESSCGVNMAKIYFLIFILFFSNAQAGRNLFITPQRVDIWHLFDRYNQSSLLIDIKNISPIKQNVTVTLLTSTKVTCSTLLQPPGSAWLSQNSAVDRPLTYKRTLEPLESVRIDTNNYCVYTNAAAPVNVMEFATHKVFDGRDNAWVAANRHSTCDSSTCPQLRLTGNLDLKISVDEDRGALIGKVSIVTSADGPFTKIRGSDGSSFFELNGGRPF